MKIFIDYYLKNKEKDMICGLRHCILTEQDIIEYALQKLKEEWLDFEIYTIEAQIDKCEI
jgi:hypothetical protein